MMNKIRSLALTFCFIGCAVLNLKAQSGIVPSGGNATGTGGSISYTIGQIDFIEASGTGGTCNQGIEQPYEIFVMPIIIQTEFDLGVRIYPNPFTEYIILSYKEIARQNSNYIIYDVQGKIILQNKLAGEETQINMAELSSGIYYIKLVDNKDVRAFKLIKK